MSEKSYITKQDKSNEEIREIKQWSEGNEKVEPLVMLKNRMFIENTRIIFWFGHLITFNWISLIDKFLNSQCIYDVWSSFVTEVKENC